MPSSGFTRKQIRLLYMGLKSLRLDRGTRALGEETHESLRKLLLDTEGGNEEVIEALLSEWDDRSREADRAAEDKRKKRSFDLEQTRKARYQKVYLWCCYEGWFSDGPYSRLTVTEDGRVILDDKDEPIAWWDPSHSCWRTRKHPDWPIGESPRVSASPKVGWK